MSYRAQQYPTASESPREHGLVAGAMTGAWVINHNLEDILRALRGERAGVDSEPPDPQPPDILTMAREVVAQQGRSVVLLQSIREQIRLLHSSPR